MDLRSSFLALALSALAGAAQAQDHKTPAESEKVVLVELFTSQGWDLCPKAEQLLGRLAEEFGPDRVATVAFHVDYFNKPWPDPFSDPLFSRREMQYSLIFDREHNLKNPNYLYLTPLVMIDGRTPMVGSNDDAHTRARDAIRAALARRPEVTLRPTLEPSGDDPRRMTLNVEFAAASTALAGREVLVEVVIVEGGLRTKVESGELAGKEYVGHNVARKFTFRSAKLSRKEPGTLRFPVELEEGWEPARCRVLAIAQDEKTGRIYQARMLRWPVPAAEAGGR